MPKSSSSARCCATWMVVAVTLLAGCQSRGKTMADAIHEDLQTKPVSEVTYRAITFESPFDEETTAMDVGFLEKRIDRMARLVGIDTFEPMTLRLVPVDSEVIDDDILWFTRGASRHGMSGYATSERVSVVYVPRYTPPRHNPLLAVSDTIIHELVHVVDGQADLNNGARWFAEGLAMSLEFSFDDAAGNPLLERPTPLETWRVLSDAKPGIVDELIEWPMIGGGDSVKRPNEHHRYVFAHSFLNFLLRERGEVTFDAKARAVMSLSDDELRDREGPWLAYLNRHPNPVAEARAYLDDPRPTLRKKAFSQLIELGTNPNATWPIDTAAIKLLALEELNDSVVFGNAFNFLRFRCLRELTDADINSLLASPRVEKRLAGWALEHTRGNDEHFRAKEESIRTELESLSPNIARTSGLMTYTLEQALATR